MPFKIVRNDITKMKVDAIVNTANPRVRVGRGVDEAIYSAAGWDKLMKEREKIGPMARGSAAITPGFDLPAKYIIHTVGPKWDEEDPEPAKRQLRNCYDNSMSLALEYGLKSIAFPLISTGSYSFPKETGLKIAYDTISRYLYASEMDVYLVVYDEEAFSLSKNLMDDIDEFIDSRYIEETKAYFGKAEELWKMETGSFEPARAMPNAPSPNAMPNAPSPKALKEISELPGSAHKKSRSILQHILPKKSERTEPQEDISDRYLEARDYDLEVSVEPKEINAFTKYDSLEDLLKNAGETFQDRLFRYIDNSGLTDVEVYKGANISKQTFSKLKQPGHMPKKRTVLALAISMKLSVDETRDLLESAGQAFSPSDKIDLAVQYCMYKGIYSIFDVEHILFEKFGETLVS